MNPTTSTPSAKPRLHPLLAGAAVAVIVFSIVGIAAMTGLLPTGNTAPPVTAAAVPAGTASAANAVPPAPTIEQKAAPVEKSAPRPVARAAAKPVVRSAPVEVAQAPADPAAAPSPPCAHCGVIDTIREISRPGEGSGLGAVAGGVVGAILGHQVGGGTGKKIATVAGAAGGAYAGHEIEKSQRKTTRYEVVVRMNDGSSRSVMLDTVSGWQIGERVRIENGTLVRDN